MLRKIVRFFTFDAPQTNADRMARIDANLVTIIDRQFTEVVDANWSHLERCALVNHSRVLASRGL